MNRIADWASAHKIKSHGGDISEDRLHWEVRLDDSVVSPPLDEWALVLGDAVHNLRSSLDVLIWSCTDEASLTAEQARHVAFPVNDKAGGWSKTVTRCMPTVPADVVERVRQVQPFNRPPSDPDNDALQLVTELDNQDKHRMPLATAVHALDIDHAFSVEFFDEAAAGRNLPPVVTMHDPAVAPGAVILEGTTLDPIAKIAGNATLQWQLGVQTSVGFFGFVELMRDLGIGVEQVIRFVAGEHLEVGGA
jgi:hypothetical protein